MKRLIPVFLIGLALAIVFFATNRDGTHSEEPMSHGDGDTVVSASASAPDSQSASRALPAVRVNKAPS